MEVFGLQPDVTAGEVENVAERTMGVTRATPARRSRARSTSAAVGCVNPKDLLEDLVDGTQRIELATLHGLEHARELRIVVHGALEVRLGTCRRDGKDLGREVLPPPLVEQAVCLEVRAMLGEPVPGFRPPRAALP